MATKGKGKGNTGELIIAKYLTTLFEAKFMRVPNSGAMIGGKNAHRKLQMDETQISYFKSDLIPPSHMKRLVIESKFYKDFPFHKLGTDEKIAQLDKWIAQTLVTVEEGDMWFVVIRINHKGSFAVFDKKWLDKLDIQNHARYFDYVWCDFESLFARNKQVILDQTITV